MVEPVTAIILGGTIVSATCSATLVLSRFYTPIKEEVMQWFFWRRRFMYSNAAIPCRAILTAISDHCVNLSANLNITIKYTHEGVEKIKVYCAPPPNEFVEFEHFYVKSISNGNDLDGFEIWFRTCHREATYRWLSDLFKGIPNFEHPYHPDQGVHGKNSVANGPLPSIFIPEPGYRRVEDDDHPHSS